MLHKTEQKEYSIMNNGKKNDDSASLGVRFKTLFSLLKKSQKVKNQNELGSLLEISPSTMSRILSGTDEPGKVVLIKLKQLFPELDLNWLLIGVGNPFLKKEEDTPSSPINKQHFQEEPDSLTQSLREGTSAILILSDTNKKLVDNNIELTRLIIDRSVTTRSEND
jgi:transcriptional regulator with XRE-family HTH domain